MYALNLTEDNMGIWGMGLTQSDEFCEVYERFMERYNSADEVSVIVSDILTEYNCDFSQDDGVLHNVYFALAKAEWMCCEQSETVLNKVKTIIETDANIAYYRELEANESDLKQRRKNLQKFWETLQTPRAKPKRRKINPLDRIKELPPVKVGECYAYKYEEGYRVLIILDRFKEEGWLEQVCCCILKETFDSFDIQFEREEIGFISNYVGVEFLAKSNLKKIATLDMPNEFRKRIPQNYVSYLSTKKSFYKDITDSLNITLSGLIKSNN